MIKYSVEIWSREKDPESFAAQVYADGEPDNTNSTDRVLTRKKADDHIAWLKTRYPGIDVMPEKIFP